MLQTHISPLPRPHLRTVLIGIRLDNFLIFMRNERIFPRRDAKFDLNVRCYRQNVPCWRVCRRSYSASIWKLAPAVSVYPLD